MLSGPVRGCAKAETEGVGCVCKPSQMLQLFPRCCTIRERRKKIHQSRCYVSNYSVARSSGYHPICKTLSGNVRLLIGWNISVGLVHGGANGTCASPGLGEGWAGETGPYCDCSLGWRGRVCESLRGPDRQ